MKWAFTAGLALLLLPALMPALPAAQAQSSTFVAAVAPGDASLEQPLAAVGSALAFLDSNSNGVVDREAPNEPVYLDTNHDGAVGYGDIRLTPFGWYPAGSLVDIPNSDDGLRLTGLPGWFATTPSGAWLIDCDASRSVSTGDLRLTGGGFVKVGPGDGDQGATLTPAQTAAPTASRFAARDTSGNGFYDPGESLYLDVDNSVAAGSGHVSLGDLRFNPGPAPVDAKPGSGGTGGSDTTTTVQVGPDGTTTVISQGTAQAGWRTLDWVLVALAVANLAAFVYLIRLQKPRSPFK